MAPPAGFMTAHQPELSHASRKYDGGAADRSRRFKLEFEAEFKKLNEKMIDMINSREEADYDYEKQIEQITQAFVKDTQWTDIVKKESTAKLKMCQQNLAPYRKWLMSQRALPKKKEKKSKVKQHHYL